MSDLLRLITLQDANTRIVLLGASILGLACGVVGVLAVLRRRALTGDAVAHAALPGVCAGYIVAGDRDFAALLLGALVFGLLAAGFISLVRSLTRVKEDAATALAIGVFFGLGIAWSRIIQNRPGGNRAGLDQFLFGKAASMVTGDAITIGAVAVVVLIVVAVLFKELKVLCFDRAFAESLWGRGRAAAMDLLVMGLVAVCTVVGLPAVGVVLMVGLLVIPAAAARFWTERLGVMLVLSGLFGMGSAAFGTALSAALPTPASMLSRGWPTGPMITLVAAALFTLSLLAAPGRGVVAAAIRRARLRARIGAQNVLRTMYERLETTHQLDHALEVDVPAPPHAAAEARAWRRAAAAGCIVRSGPAAYRFTRYGLDEARHIVRAHRLWELYLTGQAAVAPDHVDRDADQIEHLLPPELVAKLEAKLREQGRMPESVHPLPAPGGRA